MRSRSSQRQRPAVKVGLGIGVVFDAAEHGDEDLRPPDALAARLPSISLRSGAAGISRRTASRRAATMHLTFAGVELQPPGPRPYEPDRPERTSSCKPSEARSALYSSQMECHA